jgi:hypothetical protein
MKSVSWGVLVIVSLALGGCTAAAPDRHCSDGSQIDEAQSAADIDIEVDFFGRFNPADEPERIAEQCWDQGVRSGQATLACAVISELAEEEYTIHHDLGDDGVVQLHPGQVFLTDDNGDAFSLEEIARHCAPLD